MEFDVTIHKTLESNTLLGIIVTHINVHRRKGKQNKYFSPIAVKEKVNLKDIKSFAIKSASTLNKELNFTHTLAILSKLKRRKQQKLIQVSCYVISCSWVVSHSLSLSS